MTAGQAWHCDAYGPRAPEAGTLCFISGESGKRVCGSPAACLEVMAAQRKRVFDRIAAMAESGDPVGEFLAGEFTDPSQLLGGRWRRFGALAAWLLLSEQARMGRERYHGVVSSGENADDEPVHAMTARLPGDLHEWLRREAFERRVSINSLLVEGAEKLRRAAA